MNRELLEKYGFNKEIELIENRQCPLCSNKININDFRDETSLKEFIISGMCQECQDKIFREEDE